MININEYLLSKKNNKLSKDEYYVILPGNNPYLEFKKMYKNEMVQQPTDSFDFWILPISKIFDVLEKFDKNDLINKFIIELWKVPDVYSIDEFKKRFVNGDINPWQELESIKISDIL